MKAEFEKYLTMVERYLKPLPTSERVDIVKEIKGSILEMEQEDLSEEEILQRLGEPKDLAKAYLGDLLIKESDFSFTRVLTICAFYSVAGFSGMFVIPILGIVAPVFIVTGVLSVLCMAVTLTDHIFHLGLPYMENIGVFSINGVSVMNPFGEFLAALVIGAVLCFLGQGAWKLLKFYCIKVGKTKKDLSI